VVSCGQNWPRGVELAHGLAHEFESLGSAARTARVVASSGSLCRAAGVWVPKTRFDALASWEVDLWADRVDAAVKGAAGLPPIGDHGSISRHRRVRAIDRHPT